MERFDPGLTDAEIASVQRKCGLIFPPDLRAFLQFALPVGIQFPNWREGPDEELLRRLGWPLHSFWFDVQNNDDIWPEAWGPKPVDKQKQSAALKKALDDAPRLIPIYSQRHIPDEPNEAGNGILSVHQTDIISYGDDLAGYLHREFSAPLPEWVARSWKPIRFWDTSFRGEIEVECRSTDT